MKTVAILWWVFKLGVQCVVWLAFSVTFSHQSLSPSHALHALAKYKYILYSWIIVSHSSSLSFAIYFVSLHSKKKKVSFRFGMIQFVVLGYEYLWWNSSFYIFSMCGIPVCISDEPFDVEKFYTAPQWRNIVIDDKIIVFGGLKLA